VTFNLIEQRQLILEFLGSMTLRGRYIWLGDDFIVEDSQVVA
jgi:hypothetical protein